MSVALLAHGLNEDFYKEVFEHHNAKVVLETAQTIGTSSVAGFLLERERKENNPSLILDTLACAGQLA